MAKVAITFVDQDDGLVDIQVYIEGMVEGAEPTTAMQLALAMLQSAKESATLVLTETKTTH